MESSTGFEEWVLLRRSELRRQALTALAQLAAFDEARAIWPRPGSQSSGNWPWSPGAKRPSATSGGCWLWPAQPRLALGQLLCYQGYFCFRQGQHALLRPLADAGAPSATAALATAVAFLGAVLYPMGDFAEGQCRLEEGLALRQQPDDAWGAACCRRELGLADCTQGRLSAAHAQPSQSLTLSRAMGNTWATAVALNYLGTAAYARVARPSGPSLFQWARRPATHHIPSTIESSARAKAARRPAEKRRTSRRASL